MRRRKGLDADWRRRMLLLRGNSATQRSRWAETAAPVRFRLPASLSTAGFTDHLVPRQQHLNSRAAECSPRPADIYGMRGMEWFMGGKLNCKIGDLAIVVNTQLPENLGQIVEVLGPQTEVSFDLAGPGHVWQVRAVSGRATLMCLFHADGRVVMHVEGPAPDCRLRPVCGLSLDDGAQEDLGAKSRAPRRKLKPLVGLKVGTEVI